MQNIAFQNSTPTNAITTETSRTLASASTAIRLTSIAYASLSIHSELGPATPEESTVPGSRSTASSAGQPPVQQAAGHSMSRTETGVSTVIPLLVMLVLYSW